MINCKSLFFKSGNPAIDNYDFFKRFDTLYDFLTDLLDARISIIKAAKEQNEMATLGDFVLLEEKSINKEKSDFHSTRKKNYFITKECYKK